ncbi:hypothetical protein PF010_g17031 [Phytophthora fragariae]|uniref:Uncharacterized protein n=1 Tax=Phytophthora fragariae TaxID=53985 RepID=A0A6G0KPK6_9STRA|nr:hypothetical protein PF010_g17031 [Phytophthora fragariae]
MALDRELRRLLEYARQPETDNSASKDGNPPRPTARGILDRIVGIHQQTCVPSMGVSADMNLPELLVLTAETAIFQGDFEAASESVEWFFSECQLKNQFYCRAQFVRAHCGSHDAQADTGVTKLKKVLNAIHFILAVIPIATDSRKRPTYDFLVYNASVTYWQIARQLMKESTFQFLVPSLTKMIDALKLTAEADVAWLLRLQIALVYAQVDANQLANAAKTINDVVDGQITPRLADPTKAGDEAFKALFEEALRIQVHVGSFKDPECQKIVPNVKRLLPPSNKRASLLVKLQCVKSGNLSGALEAAYVEIFQEATGFLAFTSETHLDEVKTFVASLEPRALDAIDAEVIVETAIHAAFNNTLPIAAACDVVLQRKGKNMPPKIRVLYQVLGAMLLITMPSPHSGSKLSSRQRQSMLLARRVEGMKAFERALLASKRQQDPQLVERVCIYSWNLSLPLLQPHLRNNLARVLGLSSSVLEELDSLLLGFRARLYLEVAMLEVASDFLAKANSNVSKALTLDYGTITRPNDATAMAVELLSAHEDWIVRSVDTHLLPIKQKLDLKLGTDNSLSKSSEVLAMLEQVKDGKDSHQQRATLERAIDMMTEMSSPVESPAVADHIRLWSEISSLAWNGLHDGELAQRAVESALTTYFVTTEEGEAVIPKSISSEKSLMIIEVDMRLLLVEILATRLKDQATQVDSARRQAESAGNRIEAQGIGRKSAGRRSSVDLTALVLLGKEAYVLGIHRPHAEAAQPPADPPADGEELDENAILQARQSKLESEIQSVKREILKHLARALKAATTIGWTFVLENTCVYLWNYHFHVFRMVLESSRTSSSSSPEAFDPQWILPECASAFEAVYTALEAAASAVDSDLLACVGLGLSSIYEKTARLDKALAIADTFLKRKPFAVPADSHVSSVSVLHLKRFAELKSRVQIAQNAKDIVPTDTSTAQLKVVAYLEAMEVVFRQMLLPAAQQSQLMEKAQGLYQKAVGIWQTSAPEMFTAFTSDDFERVLEEEQQLLELYVEIWVRLGCGAFRLHNTKYAIECADQALLSLKSGEGKKTRQMTQLLVVGSTWKWFAMAELLYGRAILALGQGDTPAQKLLLASLSHLVRAIEYGLRVVNEIGFQAAFDVDPSNKANNVDFDEWKKDKTPKYSKPLSERDWIYFFLDHDENAAHRFHTPWTKALQSVQSPTSLHITQPALTLTYLEELMTMLRDDGAHYGSMVPVFCLYIVVFHAYIPHQTHTSQIWLELLQFELMERLNLSKFSLPLQSALDMIQSHGETLIREIQDGETSTKLPDSGDITSRKRLVLHSDRLDERSKAVASVKMLLQFGFVRQAKTLLEVLRYSINDRSVNRNNASATEALCECELLSSYILEIEGQRERALARMASALECPQVDLCRFLEWTLRSCKLDANLALSLCTLQAAEKKAAKTLVTAIRRPVVQTPGISKVLNGTASSPPDISAVCLLARVIFKQATISLKISATSNGSGVMVHVLESKRAFERCVRMLKLVEAEYACTRLMMKYVRALRCFEQNHGGSQLSGADIDPTDIVQNVVALLESILTKFFRYCGTEALQTEAHQREAIVNPLELDLATTKLELARLLMAPELSPAAIQEKEMTWYRYYEDSQRNVVAKWLNATGSVMKTNLSWKLPRAMTLITSAIEKLGENSTLDIQHAIAQGLQCQRLALLHGTDRQTADAIQHRLWTRYTSSDSPDVTWVCCHGARAQLAVAAADAAAASQPQTQNQPSIQAGQEENDDQEEEDDEEEEGLDQGRFDEMLAARAAQIQTYQVFAFEKQCSELLKLCSNELIQLLGCRRPFDCAKNVLKHQSAEVIEVANNLFEKCVSESNVQRLHLRRMKKLQKTHTSATAHSLPFQLSQLYLNQQSESFKRMSVGFRVDSIVAALPSSIRVLCLHFSPDRCFLYAALLGSTERRVAIARMEFTDIQTALLEQLRKRIDAWRAKCSKETLAYEGAHGQDEMYEFMPVEPQPSDHSGDPLEEEFTAIINDTIELLGPLFTHSAMKAELSNNLAGNTLVLLLDQVLSCLPMEALPALQAADAIARDFSIQMLHQRLMAMKKQPLRPNEVRVIVDPHKEDSGSPSGQTLTSVVKQAGWKDAFEHGQIPSVTDWQQALLARRGGGLIYVGPNRVLGSCLPLQQLTGMNVALTCQAMILLDHAENSKSSRRQSKLDSEKPAWEKEVECDPYRRALLLTLCGVNVLTINQWTTTFNGNRRLASGLLQNLSKGHYIGKALKKFSETTIAASPSTVASATDPTTSPTTTSEGAVGSKLQLKNRFRYNAVVYGLAHLSLKSGE